MATILVQDDFTDKIFFQYGAEAGVLQPPWDHVDEVQSAGTKVDVVTEIARTGNYSVKRTTPSGTKEFPENLACVKEWNTITEFYLSWWVYLPSEYYTDMLTVKDTIGGLKYMWNGAVNEWSMRFMLTPSVIYFGVGGRTMPDANKGSAQNSTKPLAGQWTHFQIYWKESMTGNGIVRAWYNDYLLYERVGSGDFYTDPQYWDATAPDSPYVTLSRYVDYNDPAGYTYLDDVVVATEKVPENYGVNEQR